ncbi:MAG: DNA polymerase III subunit beta [Eubacterium sp.]|jgi:DNA polymerase-3 subunit beta
MKFKCNQQVLTKAINIVSKAVSPRTTIPTLKGILLEIEEEGILKMTASDMDITIEEKIEVEESEKGTTVVQARLFGDIVRKMPGGDISVEIIDNNMSIKCGSSNFNIICMPSDEFPNIINTEKNASVIKINKATFCDMVRKTSFAACIDQTKGVITGILVELNKDNVKMVAIDGYRMAITEEAAVNEEENSVIISAPIMNEIAKIISESASSDTSSDDMTILADKKSAVFTIGNITVVARLLAGQFLKYNDILPKDSKIEVRIRKSDLAEGAERASLLAREGKNNLIKLSIRENLVEISSRSEEGDVVEDILCVKNGDDLDIGFNSKYLLDILRAIDDEEITMKFNTGVTPCVITPCEGAADPSSYVYLLLPVRLANN